MVSAPPLRAKFQDLGSQQEARWLLLAFQAPNSKTYNLRELGNFNKILEMLGLDGEYPVDHPKAKFCRVSVKNRRKSVVNHSIENQ